MNILIKEEDTNPNKVKICWKAMTSIKTNARTKTIAKVERASQLT